MSASSSAILQEIAALQGSGSSLQERALSLLCRPEIAGAEAVAALSQEDWDRILGWSSEHRFGPYLYYALGQANLRAHVPADVLQQLEKAYRASTYRALSLQRELMGVHKLLHEAGIDHLFLKGSYLVPFAYPELGLRPMRDIDVLVARDRALEAFGLLTGAGYTTDGESSAHPEAFLAQRKHLPRLITPQGRVAVEVHTRLSANERLTQGKTSIEFDDLIGTSVQRNLNGRLIRFTGAADLLVHLCVHAAYEHQFDNGPLTLCDIKWLVTTSDIDWAHVWRAAREQDVTRGVVLVLKRAQLEWPELSVDYFGHDRAVKDSDHSVLATVPRLMMRSFTDRQDVALMARIASHNGSRLSVIWRRIFPPAAELAMQYPIAPGSRLLVIFHVRRWLRIAHKRLPSIARLTRDAEGGEEVQQLRALNHWLEGK